MITSYEDLLAYMETCKPYENQGSWLSVDPIEPEGKFGFLYGVYNKSNGKAYIGKKIYFIGGKKTRKHPKTGKRIKNTRHGKGSGWETYTTSSDHINGEILELGKDQFTFFHIATLNTKAGLSHAEPALMMKLDVLTLKDSNGERVFYNGTVPGVRFITKETCPLISREVIGKDNEVK